MPATQPTEARIRTVSMLVLAVIASAGALYWLRPVMIPLVLAVLLTYVLGPLVDLLIRRLKVPRALAVGLALLIGTLLILFIGGLISSSVQTLAANADAYEGRIKDLEQQIIGLLQSAGIEVDIGRKVAGLPLSQWFGSLANGVVDILSNTVLVLIFAIYMLQGSAATAMGGEPGGMRSEIVGRIRRYISLKIGLSAATGAAVWLLLWLIGVDLALVFGVLAFVLNFIPSVGSIIATLLPIPVVLLDPEFSATKLTLAILLPGAVQMTVGNVLEPKLMGDQLELHPITILAALTFWGMLWGIPGMLLAVPLTAALRIVFDGLEITRPVARLMAGHV